MQIRRVSPTLLGSTGHRRHGGGEEADKLKGSPYESPRPRAEGLYLLNNVIRFAFEGSLFGGKIRPEVAFPVGEIPFLLGLRSGSVRRGFDNVRPLF